MIPTHCSLNETDRCRPAVRPFSSPVEHAAPSASRGCRLVRLLAFITGAVTAAAVAAQQVPARTVSTGAQGEAVTLSWMEARVFDPAEIWRSELTFAHPMTVATQQEIDIVRERIAAGAEPQFTAWQVLRQQADEALAVDFVPPERMFIMGGYESGSNLSDQRQLLTHHAESAYASALAWRIGGKTIHAEKAVAILKAWVETDTVFDGNDRGLQLSSHFTPMLYAADLLHDFAGWTPHDRERFEAFWRRRCLVHTDFVLLRENNWGDNALMGVLAAAIVFEDEHLAKRCLYRLNEYFVGNWKIRVDGRGTYFPREVERNRGRGGVTYSAYSLHALTQALEMARNFGPQFDWWTRPTTGNARLEDLYSDFFRWDIQHASFPWYDENFTSGAPDTTTSRMNSLEIAHSRLELDPAISRWLAGNRPVDGAEGDAFATLLKGQPIESTAPSP